MVISRTPFRISFFGGGTDYPAWYREHPGAVLATTIDKYCYINCRYLPPFFEYKSRVAWSKIELVTDHGQIEHPSVRETLKYFQVGEGFELHHDGDLPARTGLGSSSSFTVGLVNAVYALRGQMAGRMQLAKDAIHIEQDLIRENVGAQDQVMAAHGGFLHVEFEGQEIRVSRMLMPPDRQRALQDHLLLCFTGFARSASEIASEQVRMTPQRTKELDIMYQMVGEAMRLLSGTAGLEAFGRLLHEGWQIKKSLSSKISTPAIDEIYESARKAGAIGGKLLGAGSGGFLLLFVKPEDQPRVRERLKTLLMVPFEFETHGSQIIFYDPKDLGKKEAR